MDITASRSGALSFYNENTTRTAKICPMRTFRPNREEDFSRNLSNTINDNTLPLNKNFSKSNDEYAKVEKNKQFKLHKNSIYESSEDDSIYAYARDNYNNDNNSLVFTEKTSKAQASDDQSQAIKNKSLQDTSPLSAAKTENSKKPSVFSRALLSVRNVIRTGFYSLYGAIKRSIKSTADVSGSTFYDKENADSNRSGNTKALLRGRNSQVQKTVNDTMDGASDKDKTFANLNNLYKSANTLSNRINNEKDQLFKKSLQSIYEQVINLPLEVKIEHFNILNALLNDKDPKEAFKDYLANLSPTVLRSQNIQSSKNQKFSNFIQESIQTINNNKNLNALSATAEELLQQPERELIKQISQDSGIDEVDDSSPSKQQLTQDQVAEALRLSSTTDADSKLREQLTLKANEMIEGIRTPCKWHDDYFIALPKITALKMASSDAKVCLVIHKASATNSDNLNDAPVDNPIDEFRLLLHPDSSYDEALNSLKTIDIEHVGVGTGHYRRIGERPEEATPADGDCFFHTLVHEGTNSCFKGKSPKEMRNEIANFIIKHPNLCLPVLFHELDEFSDTYKEQFANAKQIAIQDFFKENFSRPEPKKRTLFFSNNEKD